MRVVYLTHSLVSDWNHGNAHFQRGVLAELIAQGHDAIALEPADGWSRSNLRAAHPEAEQAFAARFPRLVSQAYGGPGDIEAALDGADLVIVHEWTAPEVVALVGRKRAEGAPFTLLFHDTHHRAASEPAAIDLLDLSAYDGVLAFSEALREIYAARGWGRRAFTWHEAADTRVFHPLDDVEPARDVLWIGNWGDGERTAELETFLLAPVRQAGLGLTVHGVRYPDAALARLGTAGAVYGGWLPNADAPRAYALHRMTVHVPRRFYAEQLPGTPTIRVFEALACGAPLLSAPWSDCEGLFRSGDFLMVHDAPTAAAAMRLLAHDAGAARDYRRNGLETIRSRHTCAHRVDELLAVLGALGRPAAAGADERRADERRALA